jgi:hypothetical protein
MRGAACNVVDLGGRHRTHDRVYGVVDEAVIGLIGVVLLNDVLAHRSAEKSNAVTIDKKRTGLKRAIPRNGSVSKAGPGGHFWYGVPAAAPLLGDLLQLML